MTLNGYFYPSKPSSMDMCNKCNSINSEKCLLKKVACNAKLILADADALQ